MTILFEVKQICEISNAIIVLAILDKYIIRVCYLLSQGSSFLQGLTECHTVLPMGPSFSQ